MTQVKFKKLEETERKPHKRLGRHVKHDPRSKDYSIKRILDNFEDVTITSKQWKRTIPAYNQGDIGDCTGNAECGLLMTEPFVVQGRNLVESDAVALYSLATHIDPIDGQSYPPDDTGSSGIDISKAAIQKGYITAYHHGFEFLHIRQYLSNVGPLIMGANWYDSFDSTDSKGRISLPKNASVRGGHEFELSGVNDEDNFIEAWNSWGDDYGDDGKFYIPFSVFEQLMDEEGDITASVTASIK